MRTIRTSIPKFLDQSGVKTTQIYTHLAQGAVLCARRPLDGIEEALADTRQGVFGARPLTSTTQLMADEAA